MFSQRFGKQVFITEHAIDRMNERNISNKDVLNALENGKIKCKDKTKFWVYHNFINRVDNLVCLAVVDEGVLVIKTVMINWQLRGQDNENKILQ